MLKHYQTPSIAIAFSEGSQDTPNEIQLFRVGKFHHPVYGTFEITSKILAEMKKNFDEKVRGIDIAVDYKHESDNIAAGWIKSLELRENGDQLWGGVEWTPNARKILSDKEFRYISPDFTFDYQDNETLKKFGAVLLGAGLTNRPVIKNMEPTMSLSELILKVLELNDAQQSCVSKWMPELVAKGHPQDQALAIAYKKCQSGEHMGEELMAESDREKLHSDQQRRSKEYGIEVTPDGALTPPAGGPTEESLYGDPVNFKYPMPDEAQARNARVRFKQFANNYKDAGSKKIVHNRIVKRELGLNIEPSFDSKDPLDALLDPEIKAKLMKKEGKQMSEELQKKLELAEKRAQDAEAKTKELEKSAKMSEKKAQFSKLLAEGKVCAAQEEAFLEGDTVKFAELAQPVKLSTSGTGDPTGSGSKPDPKDEKDPQGKVLELAEKMVSEKKITLKEAISTVLHENQELSKKVRGI